MQHMPCSLHNFRGLPEWQEVHDATLFEHQHPFCTASRECKAPLSLQRTLKKRICSSCAAVGLSAGFLARHAYTTSWKACGRKAASWSLFERSMVVHKVCNMQDYTTKTAHLDSGSISSSLTSGVWLSSPAMEDGSSSGLDSTEMRISSTLRRAVGAFPVAT